MYRIESYFFTHNAGFPWSLMLFTYLLIFDWKSTYPPEEILFNETVYTERNNTVKWLWKCKDNLFSSYKRKWYFKWLILRVLYSIIFNILPINLWLYNVCVCTSVSYNAPVSTYSSITLLIAWFCTGLWWVALTNNQHSCFRCILSLHIPKKTVAENKRTKKVQDR